MAEDIQYALNHPDAVKIANNAKTHAYENFTWEIVTEELQNVIRKWFP